MTRARQKTILNAPPSGSGDGDTHHHHTNHEDNDADDDDGRDWDPNEASDTIADLDDTARRYSLISATATLTEILDGYAMQDENASEAAVQPAVQDGKKKGASSTSIAPPRPAESIDVRPALSREISCVSFGSNDANDDDDDATFDSEYSSKENGGIIPTGATSDAASSRRTSTATDDAVMHIAPPKKEKSTAKREDNTSDDKDKEPILTTMNSTKSILSFGPASDIISGSVIHNAESLSDGGSSTSDGDNEISKRVGNCGTIARSGSRNSFRYRPARTSSRSVLEDDDSQPQSNINGAIKTSNGGSQATMPPSACRNNNTSSHGHEGGTTTTNPAIAPQRFYRESSSKSQLSDATSSSNVTPPWMMEDDNYNQQPPPSNTTNQAAPLTQAKSAATMKEPRKQLSVISSMYDLNNTGGLDPVQQAMRDRDVLNKGRLSRATIHDIVVEQMEMERKVHRYKQVTAGLVCLMVVLALSNFGTSWASAVLSKDVVVDGDSGTVQTVNGGEVVAFQEVAFIYELASLSEEEFEERRRLVEAEMAEDPEHVDHLHRILGKKKKRNNRGNGGVKIAYDHSKVDETDLEEITRRCDGANTVSIKRTWRRDRDAFYASDRHLEVDRSWRRDRDAFYYDNDDDADADYDTICGPGTEVVKKGKKKRNKNKTKTKVVEEQVTFRKKGKGERDKSITFDCVKGQCYASGGVLLQGRGHPCRLELDHDGASECEEDLVCYDPDNKKKRGNGVCASLQMYARYNQICRVDFGLDACEFGYACYPTNDHVSREVKVGQIQTGSCQSVKQKSGEKEICDVAHRDKACIDGFTCLGRVGRAIGRTGVGYCARSVDYSVGSGWYKNSSDECVNDGKDNDWNEMYASAKQCCERALWQVSKKQCAPSYYD
jgi:hypothetical protein